MCEILDNAFNQLEKIFKEVHEIKSNGPMDDKKLELINEKRKSASLMLVLIKKYSRVVKYRVRAGRERLHHEKVAVDSNWLQFQNLLYEVSHLKREIRQCYQFKSQDEDINLLTQDEYTNLTPSDEPPSVAPENEHSQRLQLLESELKLRKHLSKYCADLCNNKKEVIQDIVKNWDRLSSLAPSIRTLLKATQPLQEALDLPLEKKWEVDRLVHMLPRPLYLIYMNLYALKSTYESEITVEVINSDEDVEKVEEKSKLLAHFERNSDSNHSIPDAVDDVDEIENERKRHLKPNAISISFAIPNPNNSGELLSFNLKYFQLLNMATALASITLNANDGQIVSEIISPDMILNNIFDNDHGNTVPIFTTIYKLQKINMSPDELLDHLNANNLGKPYRWLQEMCCIDTCEIKKNEAMKTKLQKMTTDIIKRIKQLWSARLNLLNQIKALIHKNVDMYIGGETLPQTKPTCSLAQWTLITLEEYLSNNATAQYDTTDIYDVGYVFYRAVVVRGSAKMECLVSISNKFPQESPLWTIYVHWNGEHNSANNAAIKQMEHWTNCLKQSELKSENAMLSMQLLRTMYSFDIFLETESPLYSPAEYQREKHFAKAFTKRIRSRPYRFIGGGTKNLFKQ